MLRALLWDMTRHYSRAAPCVAHGATVFADFHRHRRAVAGRIAADETCPLRRLAFRPVAAPSRRRGRQRPARRAGRATKDARTGYEQIVAPGETPKKLAEGLCFTEGPTWLKGKLYFSDMWFKNPAAGDWTGSPARSRLTVMEPDGRDRVLAHGMQSNGNIVGGTGNLIVCDMFGHRVVELDPANGRVLRVLLDRINGRPIEGPNDLVMDAKGGIYVTDPQLTPDEKKSQPGKQVYYIASDGSARIGADDAEQRSQWIRAVR